MRVWALLALLVSTLALPAAADGNFKHEFITPFPSPIQYAPQLQCDFVFNRGGTEWCDIRGFASQVTHLHARVVGQAEVHVRLDFVYPDGKLEQLAIVDCNGAQRSCVVPMVELDGKFYYGKLKLAAYAEGQIGSYVSAFVERRGQYDLP